MTKVFCSHCASGFLSAMLLHKLLVVAFLIAVSFVNRSDADVLKKIVKKGLPLAALLPLSIAGIATRGHSEKSSHMPPPLPHIPTQVKIITVPQPIPIAVPVHHHHRQIVKHHHHKGKTKIVHVPRPVKKKHKLVYDGYNFGNEFGNFEADFGLHGDKKQVSDYGQNVFQSVDTIKLGSGGYDVTKSEPLSYSQHGFDHHKISQSVQHHQTQEHQPHHQTAAQSSVMGDTVDLTKNDSPVPNASQQLEFVRALNVQQDSLLQKPNSGIRSDKPRRTKKRSSPRPKVTAHYQ